MRKVHLTGFIAVTVLAIFSQALMPVILWASDADEQIAKIQKAYESIKDVKGAFFQKSTIRDLDRTETYRGQFFIKPPLKMKWEYTGKTAQDLTINGDTVLIYKKGDKQAYKSRFDRQTYGQTPVALLGGFGNIKNEFTASRKGDSLILKPKRTIGSVTSISIKTSPEGFPIRSFTINDSHANVIEIVLTGVMINTGLKDSLFDMSLPKEVNVFEQ